MLQLCISESVNIKYVKRKDYRVLIPSPHLKLKSSLLGFSANDSWAIANSSDQLVFKYGARKGVSSREALYSTYMSIGGPKVLGRELYGSLACNFAIVSLD